MLTKNITNVCGLVLLFYHDNRKFKDNYDVQNTSYICNLTVLKKWKYYTKHRLNTRSFLIKINELLSRLFLLENIVCRKMLKMYFIFLGCFQASTFLAYG